MLRFRTAALTAAAAAALMLVPVTASADTGSTADRLSVSHNSGPLTDLILTDDSPFDGASADVVMVAGKTSSAFGLRVSGIDLSAAGTAYGAHLHYGPCVEGNGAAAGPHYNTDLVAGVTPPEISEDTEVWLDFTVTSRGRGYSHAVVPFKPLPDVRSIVIHAEETDPDTGTAGGRLACLPFTVR